MKVRRVSKEEVELVLRNCQELLYDTVEKHYVFVNYEVKLAVVVDIEGKRCTVVTVIPSSRLGKLVAKRKEKGRWVKVEL
jgi:hypothetical protein